MDCSISSPFPHCGIFHPNSVAVAATAPSSGRNLPQIMTHILQKAFFKHAARIAEFRQREDLPEVYLAVSQHPLYQ